MTQTTSLPLPVPNQYDPLARKLTIRGAGSFPSELFEYADDIEILDMSFGNLSALPHDLAKLRKLRIAFFSGNDFQELPGALADCQSLSMIGFKSCQIQHIPEHALPPNLQGLILTDNHLSSLPKSIGNLRRLKKLMLSGNRFISLPEEILSCSELQLLRLSINNFSTLPEWLFALPRLAWYSDGANPGSFAPLRSVSAARQIPWEQITIGDKIGESSKNTVHQGTYHGRPVAIKIYGSGITTDGTPDDEIQACLLTGTQSGIIGALGETSDPATGQRALVMPLIPSTFTPLGLPPDFVTLTRDTYTPEQHQTIPRYLQILQNTARTMAHLHKQGIMHGDLYAHNILADQHGHSLLGDFGAASIYNPQSKPHIREHVDVRGFGYLLDDILSIAADQERAEAGELTELRDTCLHTNMLQLPTFTEIESALQNIR